MVRLYKIILIDLYKLNVKSSTLFVFTIKDFHSPNTVTFDLSCSFVRNYLSWKFVHGPHWVKPSFTLEEEEKSLLDTPKSSKPPLKDSMDLLEILNKGVLFGHHKNPMSYPELPRNTYKRVEDPLKGFKV